MRHSPLRDATPIVATATHLVPRPDPLRLTDVPDLIAEHRDRKGGSIGKGHDEKRADITTSSLYDTDNR